MSESEDRASVAPTREHTNSLYSALGDEERRVVMSHLREADEPVGLADLTEALVARTDGGDADSEGSSERVRIRLHHCHLPKLADIGLVEYDREDRTVRSRGQSTPPVVELMLGLDGL